MRASIQLRLLAKRRGLILRGLLCLAIGWLILNSDEHGSFDTRLQARGAQSISSKVVLVSLSSSDLEKIYNARSSNLISMKEVSDVSDTFFWDPNLWHDLLKIILKSEPAKIGVNFYFPKSLSLKNLPEEDRLVFSDPRIVWAAPPAKEGANSERLPPPAFANPSQSNIGFSELHQDEDGVVRRLNFKEKQYSHFTDLVSGRSANFKRTKFINFRGPPNTFPQLTLEEILSQKFSLGKLKNKVVLIGPESSLGLRMPTPLGTMGKSEILANIIDNNLEERWILRFPSEVYILLMGLLIAFCVFIITQYPQSVALVFFLGISTIWAAGSASIFDLYYVWTPVVAPLVAIAATWIVFIGYQANKIERKVWQLQQEQAYLAELEQIKNNFVSLISHDLKTPIAKITAIADRLMMQNPNHEFTGDLKSLRSSADELNSYIKSILQVLRVESRDFKLHKETEDINELISQAITQLNPLANEKSIVLVPELEPMFTMEIDTTLIREVMVNLIENAIKYTPNSGTVSVRSFERENRVFIAVSDTGPGIPKEEIPLVWGKFVRGKDQEMKTKGSGLGLYLVKYFVELHGGEVYLESHLGKGTTVTMSLPLESSLA